MVRLTAYIDGSCIGNPGDAGYGVVIKDENGVICETAGEYIGRGTNNIAEYRGLLGCLELVEKYNIDKLLVYSDSQLLVNQINGLYKVKQKHLRILLEKIKKRICSASYQFEIRHIPREENKEADRIARGSIRLKDKVTDL